MECAICYNRLKKYNLAITSCKHSFCLKCMLKHYSNSTKYASLCPICREDLIGTPYPPTPANSPRNNDDLVTYIDCVFRPDNYFVTYDSTMDYMTFELFD